MGYRYGEHKYSEGRYSRWPDWWHDKRCLDQDYTAVACEQEPWTPLANITESWAKDDQQSVAWESGGESVPPWEKGDQQAVLAKQAVRWGRTR